MPTCVIPPRTRTIDLLSHHHKRSSKLTCLAIQPRTTHWLHLLPHTFPPSPTVTSCTIPPSHPSFPLLLAFAVTFPTFPQLQAVPAPAMSTSTLIAPTLCRNDTPIICTRRQRQSQSVRCAGPSYSIPRPKRARVYRRYLRPCSG
jgi:hypothetical protein